MQQRPSSDNGGGGGAQASGPRGPAAPPDGGPLQAALTEALGAFSRDPGGTVRRLLDGAEQALAGASAAARHGGGISGLAAAASRLLSDGPPARQPDAGTPGGAAAVAGGPHGEMARDVPSPAAATSDPEPKPARFVQLRQPGAAWSLYVRAEEVDAVTPAAAGGDAGCVLHLSDGGTVEAGEDSDAAAERLSPRGFVRLSQAGTQRGLYVRPGAVLAVTAPKEGEGCVLRFRGGRVLPCAEATAVASHLLVLIRPPAPPSAV